MEGAQRCHPYPLGPPWRSPAAFVDSPLVTSYLRLLHVTAGDFSLAWEKPGSKPIRDKSWWINSAVSWASSTVNCPQRWLYSLPCLPLLPHRTSGLTSQINHLQANLSQVVHGAGGEEERGLKIKPPS